MFSKDQLQCEATEKKFANVLLLIIVLANDTSPQSDQCHSEAAGY
jgi:hypothetical protein